MSRHPRVASGALTAPLRGKTGRAFWRSLDELSKTPDFQAFLDAEFPALETGAGADRRQMLKLTAASLALAGLGGCSGEADEAALPYVEAPDGVTPGRAKYYASAVTFAGYAQPLLGKTVVGRPVKLDGNPEHPASRGASDIFLQAALLDLYDPDRSQSPLRDGEPASWSAFDAAMAANAAELDRRGGDGFRLLTGAVSSPTLLRQIAALTARWPAARWHAYEPIHDDFRFEAARLVFGRPLEQHYHFDQAEIVVSLDDDFLGPGPKQTMHARLWARRRLAFQKGEGTHRLFVAEPTPSLTGAMAEHRLIAAGGRIDSLTLGLAAAVGIETGTAIALSQRERRWIDAAAAALRAHPGKALVNVGARHQAQTQAIGLIVNEKIGALNAMLKLTEPVLASPADGARSIEALIADMTGGRVTTLAIIGANPVYAGPGGFATAMAHVPLTIHAGLHEDETAARCRWHVPLAHELESWSDARSLDGLICLMQPLVRPFYKVRPLHAVIDNLSGGASGDREIVEGTWRAQWGGEFATRWRDSLVRGFIADSAPAFAPASIVDRPAGPPTKEKSDGLTAIFTPDPTVWDGRFAGNAWLQETPKPLTKITWGNAVLVSPKLAQARKLANGDLVRVTVGGKSIEGPAFVAPGQEENTLTLSLGYGRARAGRTADGLGYDAFPLWRESGGRPAPATLTATGARETVATMQMQQAMDGFDFVRTVQRSEIAAARFQEHAPAASFYPGRTWDSPSWGMSIDLDLCIGCNACVAACVAENNIAVVGKERVAEGRIMHWLRVDHYHEGDPDDPKSFFQPVPCMHCEQAPCEMGCPVNAAVHSADGLNLQVYNRCIGTRTCSSFCPYKVRRFNWFDYTGDDPESIRAMRNPDVTVRARGVMEKCTYCVQRISEARIAAKIDGRAIRDGEVRTACQQACPTQAIVFGDVVDPESEVSRRKASGRDYSLLEEANTRPRTTYLARIAEAPAKEGER